MVGTRLQRKDKDWLAMTTFPIVEFCEAILKNDVQQIRQLVSDFPQLLTVSIGSDKVTGLHYAAGNGREDSINELICLGADINSTLGGRTPLHCAVLDAPVSTIELLLRHGADPNVISKDDETPMLIAARRRSLFDETDEQVVPDLLEQYGGEMDIHSATALGRLETVRKILASNKCAIQESLHSDEILLNGSCRRSRELMNLLLENGADPNAGTETGRSPLQQVLSSVPCDPDIIRMLLEHGSNPNVVIDEKGQTLIDFSKSIGQSHEILDLLNEYSK